MKALDRIMLDRADQQTADDQDWRERRGPRRKHPCPEPGCTMRYAPQSKLKLCPTHSKVVYAQRAKENGPRYQAERKARAAK